MTVGAKVKQTFSTLKGVTSTLEVYISQTQDETTSSAYREALDVINEVVNDLDKRIQTLEFEEPQYKGL